MMKKSKKIREMISSGLAICFYILLAVFSWYAIFQKSFAFYTGEFVGMPGNPKILPEKILEPTLRYCVYAVLLIALYAFVFGSTYKKEHRLGQRTHRWNIPWWMQAVLLFAFSWWMRMQVVDLIGQNTVQIMDFERVFRMSLEEGPIFADVGGVNFYRAFPNWALYVKLIHCLNVHFGAVPLTGIMWNVVASCFSVVFLYFIVYFTTKKEVLAILSALLFSCNPFYLFYEILLSPDFTFLFLCLLALLILVCALRFSLPIWAKGTAMGCFGVVLALSSFFKSIDKILIIALLIVFALKWIAKGNFTKKQGMRWASFALVFVVAYTGTMNYTYRYIDDYIGGNSNRNVSPYFLSVGMDAKNNGQWSKETIDLYLGLTAEYNYDFEIVNQEMKTHLKEMIAEQKEQELLNLEFFDFKLFKAWGNNEGTRFIMNTIDVENPLAGEEFYEKYLPVIQASTVVIGFLMALGAMFGMVTRERRIVMLSGLMVFGFALLLLISEVQPRYKTVVFPFLSVVAAYGIYGSLRLIQWAAVEITRKIIYNKK